MPISCIRMVCLGLIGVLPLLGQSAAAQSSERYSYDADETYRSQLPDRYDQGRPASPPPRDSYSGGRAAANDAYQPSAESGRRYDDYDRAPRDDSFSGGRRDSYSGDRGGSQDAYAPPPRQYDNGGYPEPRGPNEGERSRSYEQGEIVAAGHSFFGAVSKGLASAVEYAFKSEGRPNGYILGEDAGGAFVVGLRYGEGKLFTKDAGTHKIYWQGPSLGYDAGAEGSKTMVLVYNMYDPGDIYHRFAGAEGSAYLVGGVSVQFQTYGHVKLAVIRSGVGVRLGANVGYSKYSRSPTWNPL